MKVLKDGIYNLRLVGIDAKPDTTETRQGGKVVSVSPIKRFSATIGLHGPINPEWLISTTDERYCVGDAPTFTVRSYQGAQVSLRPGELYSWKTGDMGWERWIALIRGQYQWNAQTGERFASGVPFLRGKLGLRDETADWPAKNTLVEVYSASTDFSDLFSIDAGDHTADLEAPPVAPVASAKTGKTGK